MWVMCMGILILNPKFLNAHPSNVWWCVWVVWWLVSFGIFMYFRITDVNFNISDRCNGTLDQSAWVLDLFWRNALSDTPWLTRLQSSPDLALDLAWKHWFWSHQGAETWDGLVPKPTKISMSRSWRTYDNCCWLDLVLHSMSSCRGLSILRGF